MTKLNLSDLSQKMRGIDIAMLSTHSRGGTIASRPMSNNRDVDYDGASHYFTWESSLMVEDIRRDEKVTLTFQGADSFSISVEGKAQIIRDKSRFRDHWVPDLDNWFENGIDTEGVAMIRVDADRIHYWHGSEDGEIKLGR